MKAVLFFVILSAFSLDAICQRPATRPASKPQAAPAEQSPTPAPTPTEKTQFETASSVAVPSERIAALQTFLEDFPETNRKPAVLELITVARADAANENLRIGNKADAVLLLTKAVEEAPEPIAPRLYSEVISKFPNLLFVNGEKEAAFKIAEMIEARSANDARRLLSLATFYISTENSEAALRVANLALELEPESSASYQILGLAHRLNFDLDASAAAYQKAVELEPDSINATRALAELKRALGRPAEALELFRKLLETTPDEPIAQSGEVLALFDLGKRQEAEAAFDRALKANPGNAALVGNVAYWYAANGDAANAILHAEEAIDLEPRYVWSHIALGRGLMMQGRYAEAEQALVKARKYGRFPTLEYEIALARIGSGYFRDAIEDVRGVFAVRGSEVETALGGRVLRAGKTFSGVLADERRASIFEPKSSDEKDLAAQLAMLIVFDQAVSSGDADEASKAAQDFAAGADAMQLHRQLYAATRLLEKRLAPETAFELARNATARVDDGLNVKHPAAAVMASELYDRRRAALIADQFIVVPDVPKQTLSAVVRGRIEETAGWALFQQERYEDASIRLRRAMTVLPPNSAWWRSAMWRLGAALEANGKDKEALDSYVASYRSEPGSGAKYLTIRALYQRINGNTDELETLVGPSPLPLDTVTVVDTAEDPEPAEKVAEPAENKIEEREEVEDKTEKSKSDETAAGADDKTKERADRRKEEAPSPLKQNAGETPEDPKTNEEPRPREEEQKTEEPRPAELTILEAKSEPEKTEPAKATPADTQKPNELEPEKPKLETEALAQEKPEPDRIVEPELEKPREEAKLPVQTRPAPEKAAATGTKSFFDPVIITIPTPKTNKPKLAEPRAEKTDKADTPDQTDDAETKIAVEENTAGAVRRRVIEGTITEPDGEACTINISQNSVSLVNSVGSVVLLVGTGSDMDTALITARSSSPGDLEVIAEPGIEGITGRALFLVRSRSAKTGMFQVTFALPCGQKVVNVSVR